MRISHFYGLACADRRFFESLNPNKQTLVVKDLIRQVCRQLKQKVAKNDIVDEAKAFLEKELFPEWFAFSWQKEMIVADTLAKLQRFLIFIGEVNVIDANVSVGIPFSNGNLEGSVSLLCQKKDGNIVALLLFPGESQKGLRGKSIHTNLNYDLYGLVAKNVLEKSYPGITIQYIYLTHPDDGLGKVREKLENSPRKGANIFSLSYEEYYQDGIFLHHKMLDTIRKVVSSPQNINNCWGCPHAGVCKNTQRVFPAKKVEDKERENVERSYSYTIQQKEVISHKEGPLLVCAGPGSGKTAALVGRIRYLMDEGIDPEYILAITFTREAAGELRERINSFTAELPTVSTIHGLCYDILRHNQERVGKEVVLMTSKERLSLIELLLEAFPQSGFNKSRVDGPNGLLKAVDLALEKYSANQDGEWNEDFIPLAQAFFQIVEEKGYISFNEQISLCLNLLEEHPDVRKAYGNLYRYIMVDEYQDVDAKQARLIELLAQEHRNLVVVGDDDQSIYSFRGGSYKHMLEFMNTFPEAKKIVLHENFRSTSSLVNAAQSIIRSNSDRISKEVISGTNTIGSAPTVIKGMESDLITKAITSLEKEGFDFNDMAILSMKNATLQQVAEQLDKPVIVEKALLREDPLTLITYATLLLYRDRGNLIAWYQLLRLYGFDERAALPLMDGNFSCGNYGSYEEPMSALKGAFFYLDRGCTAKEFLQFIAMINSLDETVGYDSLSSYIEEHGIKTVAELLSSLEFMIRFLDETRMDVSHIEAIHLVTGHESKGREWRAVILLDDFSHSATEEARRLFYVAITRAKERLFVFYDQESSLATEL